MAGVALPAALLLLGVIPMSAEILWSDFGARVIDVEPPEGHATRRLWPRQVGADEPWSGLHALLSPNKQSVVAADPEQALAALTAADVVLRFGRSGPGAEVRRSHARPSFRAFT